MKNMSFVFKMMKTFEKIFLVNEKKDFYNDTTSFRGRNVQRPKGDKNYVDSIILIHGICDFPVHG